MGAHSEAFSGGTYSRWACWTQAAAFKAYQDEKRRFEATTEFARASGRFDLTARGKINTYALFAELFANLTSKRGRAGLIVPTALATSDTTKQFFEALTKGKRLVSFFNFFEIRQWFLDTDDRNPFGLLTLGNASRLPEFSFFLTSIEQLTDPERRFCLSAADIERINPDTKTAPIFRARADAELAATIYRNVARTERPLEWINLKQNVFTSSSKDDLAEFARQISKEARVPIFRGSMIQQYDHRFATFVDGDFKLVDPSAKNPEYQVYSDKYVSSNYYLSRMRSKAIRSGYHISIRKSLDQQMNEL